MWYRYTQDPTYVAQVDTFLTAGDKASVESIFKEIGINTTSAAVFEEGLNILEQEIKAFTALAKKLT
jgi:oligoendopeptidase F